MTDIQINRPDLDLTDLPSPAPDSPVEALGWLGRTADEVAESLRLRGIRGRQALSHGCPLARYLNEWWDTASVFSRVIVWGVDEYDRFHEEETPTACYKFLRQFDRHEYPDLLA